MADRSATRERLRFVRVCDSILFMLKLSATKSLLLAAKFLLLICATVPGWSTTSAPSLIVSANFGVTTNGTTVSSTTLPCNLQLGTGRASLFVNFVSPTHVSISAFSVIEFCTGPLIGCGNNASATGSFSLADTLIVFSGSPVTGTCSAQGSKAPSGSASAQFSIGEQGGYSVMAVSSVAPSRFPLRLLFRSA